MVKNSKPQSQKNKNAAAPKNIIGKINKISKVKQTPSLKTHASNPKPQETKQLRSGQTPLKFYNLNEDSQLLTAYNNRKITNSKSSIAKDLSNSLNRSLESIRDRIKRYISRLSNAEAKEIYKMAKKNPGFYIHFKGNDNHKKFDKISEEEPSIYNRDKENPSGTDVGFKKPGQAKNSDFSWIQKKINAADPYFAIDHSVHFLNSLFTTLIEDGVERNDVEAFINAQEGEVTLFEILNNFVKKEQQKSAKAK